jgi:hypothetical protein
MTVNPAGHAQTQIARHQRRGLVLMNPVDQIGRTGEAADLENVAKILIGDQGRLSALAFDSRSW